MQRDPNIDYAFGLHECECGSAHELRSYPVDDGFVVAVCCKSCRDHTGLPRRYSTETEPFLTFDLAERRRKRMLTVKGIRPVVGPPRMPYTPKAWGGPASMAGNRQ